MLMKILIGVHPFSGLVVFVGDGKYGGVPLNFPIKFKVMWLEVDVSFVEVYRSTVADRPVELNEGGSNAKCFFLSDINIELEGGMFAKDSDSSERTINRGGRLEECGICAFM